MPASNHRGMQVGGGAPAVPAVMNDPGSGAGTKVTAGGAALNFLFLTAGTEPTPEVKRDRVLIGRQSVTIRDGHLVLGQMAEP